MTEPLVFEKSRAALPPPRLPEAGVAPASRLPDELRRKRPPALPRLSEPEIMRHYSRLASMNYSISEQFYPLGSCTMKYNPVANEEAARLPGFADLHPYQDEDTIQGALELMWLLESALARIVGVDRLTLQPAAGAHGEWTALRMIQEYHRSRGEHRTEVIVPDSAHGTNPASAALCGYRVVEVRSGADGRVDVGDLEAKLSERVAALMLTNPNTLGLFEREILEMAEMVHATGAKLYYDGANLNALMGICRPGDMGFDAIHLNLHKTFTTPHGGGGPGAGPIAVSERIEPFLPRPQVVRREGDNGHRPSFDLDFDRPQSIGRLRGFQGNFGVFVRSYAYILSLGADGLAEASETAVLNANYLKARLAQGRAGERLPIAFDRHCMHEFVLSGKPMKRELGLATLDLAKRLLDFGFHPPTVYFPLLVEEALMVEPTETETKESLDAFAEAIEQILTEVEDNPDIAKNAPYTTPVRRLDEVKATRQPVVRQRLGE